MKRVGVISDSHGDRGHARQALYKLEAEAPLDALIHCGDGWRDIAPFAQSVPQAAYVRGNCDGYASQPEEALLITVGGVCLFITHGHRYGVKNGLDALADAALARGAQIACFGHTHRRYCQWRRGVLLLNPGSCAYTGDCALILIGNEGEIRVTFPGGGPGAAQEN